ncbi:MAG TPA: hypothetical protein GYA07_03515 [Verrucomicrobia bacterium]|nr:hypothetical protein [Verrucomicrobiota bacterium]HOP96648.1 hypothetical protein [Verrucomicrobiota bacterium]HPU56930.1 hypothetical protein [Verrucomicrobiota bacterium]
MRTRIVQCLVAFLLVASIGGHWALLQSVAWVGMIIDHSREAPLSVALQKTFSGDNPCSLCKAVEAGKKSEKEKKATQTESKLDFCLQPVSFALFSTASFPQPTSGPDSDCAWLDSPPVPPPRAV